MTTFCPICVKRNRNLLLSRLQPLRLVMNYESEYSRGSGHGAGALSAQAAPPQPAGWQPADRMYHVQQQLRGSHGRLSEAIRCAF